MHLLGREAGQRLGQAAKDAKDAKDANSVARFQWDRQQKEPLAMTRSGCALLRDLHRLTFSGKAPNRKRRARLRQLPRFLSDLFPMAWRACNWT